MGRGAIAEMRTTRIAKGRDVRFWFPEEKPCGALSNLYPRSLVFEGIRYRSAEHAYKAGQARRAAVRNWLRNAPTAQLVALSGERLPKSETVQGWSRRRIPLMRRILKAKFTQHPDLRRLLLGTGVRRLVEHAPDDNPINRFWSEIKGSRAGKNHLGRLLMELRRDLRESS